MYTSKIIVLAKICTSLVDFICRESIFDEVDAGKNGTRMDIRRGLTKCLRVTGRFGAW